MNNHTTGILLGGVFPALLFGIFAILTKASSQHGLTTSAYLIVIGLAIASVGVLSMPILSAGIGKLSWAGINYGVLAGLCWGCGMLLVSWVLLKFGTPISVLAPLYNMNTLVTVLLGLWIFAEWREVQALKLLAGTALITFGALVVARA